MLANRLHITVGLIVTLMVSVALCPATGKDTTKEPAGSKPLAGKVTMYKSRPTIFVNDKPMSPIIYSLTDEPQGCWTWQEVPRKNIQEFADRGVKLFQVDIFIQHIWQSPDKFDIEPARKQIRGILEICPDAAVFFRFHINTPLWWNEANPDECVAFADGPADYKDKPGVHRILDGDLERCVRPSLASEKWRDEVTEKLREFLKQFSRTPEGNALVGIQIACGVYGEWHYWGFLRHEPDTSPAMAASFRKWLKDKYGSDKSLQKAWNDENVTLKTATVPGTDKRKTTEAGSFRDPEKERQIIDYYQCQHQAVADDIIHFCKVARESWPRPIITGTFYGYFFGVFGRAAAGGHLQMERVLNSPYVDYLSAPQSYNSWCRDMGGTSQSRGVLESVRLHKKLWLDEMDQVTTFARAFGNKQVEPNIADDVAIMRRNVLESLMRGMGLWFYDFGAVKGRIGWWDQNDILADIKQIKNIFDENINKQFGSAADVLLVFDTDSYYYLGDGSIDPIAETAVNQTSADAYYSGAAFDTILFMDLDKVSLKQYRSVVFVNTFLMSEKQKEFIKNKVAKNGRHLVWIYAPGYTDGRKLDSNRVLEIVGMKLEKVTSQGKPEIEVKNPDFPAVRFRIGSAAQPLFAVKDESAIAVGYFKDSNDVALAYKNLKDYTSWYCSLPLRNGDLMREIFRRSGAHIYNDKGDVIYAGGGLLCVHTRTGGKRDISLRNGKIIAVELPANSTTLFDNDTGRIVLK